jgi:hypothetical protein
MRALIAQDRRCGFGEMPNPYSAMSADVVARSDEVESGMMRVDQLSLAVHRARLALCDIRFTDLIITSVTLR